MQISVTRGFRGVASASVGVACARACVQHTSSNSSHRLCASTKKKLTTSDTSSRQPAHPTRSRHNSAVQCSAVQPAKCPRHPSRAKQGDNRSRVKTSQSSQPSPVVRSPSPLPTANPPESALPPTGAADSAFPPPQLLSLKTSSAPLTRSSPPGPNTTRSHPRVHVDIERQPQSPAQAPARPRPIPN